MATELLSEQEVKDRLGIQDFRSIPKTKLVEFVSSIPNMDKEVAIKCIEQFPKFADYSKEMVIQLKDVTRGLIDSADKSRMDAIEAYNKVLDDLAHRLDKRWIPRKERMYIMETMVEIADKIADLDREHKFFLLNMMKSFGQAVLGIALIAGTIVGGVFKRD